MHRLLILAFALVACGRPAEKTPDARSASTTETKLPLVSGCGCAYQCARGVRSGADGVWEVTHDFLDSTTIKAVIETRCFDSKGLATPGTCQRVFYDRTPCGGECIPSTQFVHCGS